MSTSGTTRKPSSLGRLILTDLFATLLCALFGAVYERFSHGVYAYGMLYAFAFPLVLGVLPLCLIETLHMSFPGDCSWGLYHAGIATLTVGSLVSGALEIYGTTNPLTVIYWFAGEALVLFGGLLFVSRMIRGSRRKDCLTGAETCRR